MVLSRKVNAVKLIFRGPLSLAYYHGVGKVKRMLQDIPDISVQTGTDVNQRSRGVMRVQSLLLKTLDVFDY